MMSFLKPRIMQGSYSRLKTYDQCPFLARLKFIEKLKEPDSMYALRGGEIHKKAAAYIMDPELECPLPLWDVKEFYDELRVEGVQTELQLAVDKDWRPCEWFGPQVYLRAIVDVLLDLGDRGIITDHKTGKVYDDHVDQQGLYAAIGFAQYPDWKDVSVRMTYTDQKHQDARPYSRDRQYESLKHIWDDKMLVMTSDELFIATPNAKCKWCHFRNSNEGPCQYG